MSFHCAVSYNASLRFFPCLRHYCGEDFGSGASFNYYLPDLDIAMNLGSTAVSTRDCGMACHLSYSQLGHVPQHGYSAVSVARPHLDLRVRKRVRDAMVRALLSHLVYPSRQHLTVCGILAYDDEFDALMPGRRPQRYPRALS